MGKTWKNYLVLTECNSHFELACELLWLASSFKQLEQSAYTSLNTYHVKLREEPAADCAGLVATGGGSEGIG